MEQVYQCFGGTFCLSHQGRILSEAINVQFAFVNVYKTKWRHLPEQNTLQRQAIFMAIATIFGHLCGLVVRVPGYRFGGPGSIPGTTRFSEK
jgi:hypothetical protein